MSTVVSKNKHFIVTRTKTETIFYGTSQLRSDIGFLKIVYGLKVNNQNGNNFTNTITTTRNGVNVITTTITRVGNVMYVTEKVGLPFQGIRNVSLRYVFKSPSQALVTGTIDGKKIIPTTIHCSNRGCQSPVFRFTNGTTLHFTIDKKSEIALAKLNAKFLREFKAFLTSANDSPDFTDCFWLGAIPLFGFAAFAICCFSEPGNPSCRV
jgi:hypothetical protein